MITTQRSRRAVECMPRQPPTYLSLLVIHCMCSLRRTLRSIYIIASSFLAKHHHMRHHVLEAAHFCRAGSELGSSVGEPGAFTQGQNCWHLSQSAPMDDTGALVCGPGHALRIVVRMPRPCTRPKAFMLLLDDYSISSLFGPSQRFMRFRALAFFFTMCNQPSGVY